MNLLTRSQHCLVRVVLRAIVAVLVVGAAPAGAQLVDLATSPLYGGRQPHPNVAVTTSVEFPTVGAAYLNVGYNRNSVYLGYFDPKRCYVYMTTNGGYFDPAAAADPTTHECPSQFSGNFMNYLTMSAIDEFRYAMTGGNRDDENGPNNGTIIQRAYLPDGSINGVPDFYALGSNFPRHVVGANGYFDYYYIGSVTSSVFGPLPGVDDGTIVWITSCRSQMYLGSQQDGNCGSPRNDYGTFNVRVNVCTDTEGPVRTDLCLQYGGSGGRYKPAGETQKNADRMRFSAFGYLMDHETPGYSPPCNDSGWNRCRYGGVMRAPMKYVGPLQYDANQIPSTNGRSEVNTDGTFNADPEGTAIVPGGNSGFINYINKFGASGVYKRFDTMSEMYYEAIRYFQNLGPTALATDNLPGGAAYNAVLDNFPIVTAWSDPILSTCSANYIINLSDANTWDDTYLPGYNGSPGAGYGRPGYRAPEGGLNAYDWTAKIAALESTTPSITQDDVRPNLGNIQNQNTGAGAASYFAAGAAFWANVNDIRTDLIGKQTIKTISFDVAEASIDIHDRQLYLMGKYGGYTDNTTDETSNTYGNPFLEADPNSQAGLRTNAEWEDATGSAYPTNYLLASNPQKLITGLRAAFARINADTGTLSGAALTSANLTYGAAGAYIATFDPRKWSGSVLRKSLSVVAGNLVVSPNATWTAGDLLTTRCGAVLSGQTTCQDTDTSPTRRNIVTTVSVAGVRTATNFTWTDLAVDSAYKTALETNPATGVVPTDPTDADTEGHARLNYLRGYRADEASALTYRPRDSALGDIINSGPVFEGPPTSGISDPGYENFYTSNSGRTQAVYFGANDGMMHAIDADSGQELFAYVPGFVGPTLNVLTNPGYAHEPFVDAVPAVQEAYVNGAWKTVLVSGVGNGAQGVFALDVTNPAAFGPTKVLFEFSDADDADLGNVMTSPEIVKVQTGTSSGVPTYGYFAVVTSYDNRRTTNGPRADGHVSSDSTNRGVLLFLSLDRQINTPWVLGSNYYKLYFPASDTTMANGLGGVSQFKSRSGSGAAAALYFGDLQGNLWRFNTTGADPSAWLPARGTLASPLPIFTATTATNVRQPIVARPELATGPYGTTMVFFGTGKYYGQTDLAPTNVPPAPTAYAQQSEYALIDNGSTTAISRGADLAVRTASVSGNNLVVTGTPFTYSGAASKKGWVLDFPSSVSAGERSVTKPAVDNGLLTFTTLTLSADICGSGNGFIYQLNALSGLPFLTSPNGNTGGYSSTVGIPGPPRVVDLVLTSGLGRATGEQINQRIQTTLVSGTTSKIDASGIVNSKAPPVGRINWREITNYNDLKP